MEQFTYAMFGFISDTFRLISEKQTLGKGAKLNGMTRARTNVVIFLNRKENSKIQIVPRETINFRVETSLK